MNMQNSASDSIRKYLYSCKSCETKFKIVIDVSIFSVHQAFCPECQTVCKFDNRQGLLFKRANAARYSAKNQPGNSPTLSRPNPLPQSQNTFSPSIKKIPGPVALKHNQIPLTPPTQNVLKQPAHNSGKIWQKKTKSASSYFSEYINQVFVLFKNFFDQRGMKGIAILTFLAGVSVFSLLLISVRFPSLYLSESPESYLAKLKGQKTNRIIGRNGNLIGELFRKKTGNINSENIPKDMAKTLIFVEDTDFYHHSGIKWSAISRAFVKNIFSFGYSQGGSTITQQLARILLSNREKNILRKLKETSLAYYLEDNLTKDEILAGYMSLVYLGHGSLGFDNAAIFYFDKPVETLTFFERLTLASLPSAPERYSPLRNPDLLEMKMSHIFERMQDASFEIPKSANFQKEISNLFLNLNKSPGASIFGNRQNVAPWVSEHIRLHIKKILGADLQYSSGLLIETTIDRKLQIQVNKEIKQHINEKAGHFPAVRMKDDKIVARFGNDERSMIHKEFEKISIGPMLLGLSVPSLKRPLLQAAAVGIESKSGQIVFLQGGSNFGSNNQLNRVTNMRRQTGSSIKPVVYSAAIESGAVHAATMLEDRPIFVSGGQSEKGYWLPGNYSGIYEGNISVRTALAKSQNIPAISVLRKAGLPRVSEQFKKFFFPIDKIFKLRYREDETVAIGSLEMSPLEMAAAYSAFGNNGSIIRPYLIKKISDSNGKVLYQYNNYDEFNLNIPKERQVIRPDAAQIMVSIMRDSGKYGGVHRGGFRGSFIGKTGTSNQYRDTWFAGATADITTVVWVGYDNPGYSMYHGTGAGLAGPLWGRIMRHSLPVKGRFSFKPSAIKLRVCTDDGTRTLQGCKKIINELFLKEYLPEQAKEKSIIKNDANQGKKENPEVNNTIGNDNDFD